MSTNTQTNQNTLATAGVHILEQNRSDKAIIRLAESDSSSKHVEEFTDAIYEDSQRHFKAQMKLIEEEDNKAY